MVIRNDRREFLRRTAAFGVATFIHGLGVGCAYPRKIPLRNGASGEPNWKVVRSRFPLTHDRVYFNTGGLGASPYRVTDRVKGEMDRLEEMSEVGSFDDARQRVARFFGVDETEIALTRNTTEGTNIVAWGLPLLRGDEVLMSSHEHVGGSLAWLRRMKIDGIIVRTFEPADTVEGNLQRISDALGPRTRVVSLSHVTCTTGLRFPVKEVCELARDKGVWTFIDGAQSAGMMPLSLAELGCDFFATSGHKWLLGPKETGVLYVRSGSLDTLSPTYVGGHSDVYHDFGGRIDFVDGARRFEYGTRNTPLYLGLEEAIDFIEDVGIEAIWKRSCELARMTADGLREIKGMRVLSPMEEESASAMVTFKAEGWDYRKLGGTLNREYKLRTRVVPEAELEANRVSLNACYNSEEEVQRLLDAVGRLAG